MQQSDRRSGLSRLARAGLSLLVVLAGVAILALTAGPVAAPADVLPMSDASATPGAVEALVGPNSGAETLEPSASVTSEVVGGTSAGGTPATAATGAIVLATTAPASPGIVTQATATTSSGAPAVSATARTQPTVPGSPVTPTPGAQNPVQPTATSPTLASPTQMSPTATSPTVAPPTETSPTATSPTVAPPATYEDLGDFESFLIQYRRTIAGQPFDILSLTVDTSDAAMPYFVLEVEGSESTDVFGAQTGADTLDFGRLLLGDVIRYLGGAPCTVVVSSIYPTASVDACAAAAPWCQVGPKDESGGTWPVDWIYVRARYENGVSSVEAWNASP